VYRVQKRRDVDAGRIGLRYNLANKGGDNMKTYDAATRLKSMAEFRYQLRRFLNFSEMASERCGVGAQQYQLMQVIAAMPEGQEASITYLAERMVLRHNSTVELVDRAQRVGLVRRETDAKDMRRSLVKMTPEGEAILEQLVAEHLRELPFRCEDLIHALLALREALHSTGVLEAQESTVMQQHPGIEEDPGVQV
jgi:DNA-binding MarR family transcriptional regulator